MRLRQRWRWLLGAMLSTCVIAAITGWLMFQHIPAWYHPTEVSPADYDRVRTDFTLAGDDLNLAIGQTDEPFHLRLTQQRLNTWLAAREQIWPLSRNWLGKAISDPVVLIGEDGVRVGATCRFSGLCAVLSARLELTADDDHLHVRLLDTEAGSLPIPEYLLRKQLAQLDATGWTAPEHARVHKDDLPLPPLSSLLDGADLPNTWTSELSKRLFRIVDVRLESGAVDLTIEPLERHRPRH